jgi:hypothetical protein
MLLDVGDEAVKRPTCRFLGVAVLPNQKIKVSMVTVAFKISKHALL